MLSKMPRNNSQTYCSFSEGVTVSAERIKTILTCVSIKAKYPHPGPTLSQKASSLEIILTSFEVPWRRVNYSSVAFQQPSCFTRQWALQMSVPALPHSRGGPGTAGPP